MASSIQWTNQRREGSKLLIDGVYQGSEPLESFDLNLVFAQGAVHAVTPIGYPAGWTILSNPTGAGNWLMGGFLNPSSRFLSGQKLLTLQIESHSDRDQALSFTYSGSLNSSSLPPSAYRFESSGNAAATPGVPGQSTGPVVPLIPLTPDPQGSSLTLETGMDKLGTVNGWIGRDEGEMTALSGSLPQATGAAAFDSLTSPLLMAVRLGAATAQPTLRLYLDMPDPKAGYWAQSSAGTWVNLTSQRQGGLAQRDEGGNVRTVLQFKTEDGGPVDADREVNGQISLVGIVGTLSLDLAGKSSDLAVATGWI